MDRFLFNCGDTLLLESLETMGLLNVPGEVFLGMDNHGRVCWHGRKGMIPNPAHCALCPGRAESQLLVLKAFLHDVLEAVAAGRPYQEEHGLFE
jgi:hypothetical protein